LELFAFDEAYLGRLREGQPSTESHFVAYFSELLQLKLRARHLAPDAVEDLRQETFARVIRSIRTDGGLREASRLGAFVNSVCNNVLMEHYRSSRKSMPLETAHVEIQDKVVNLENLAITEEARGAVRRVLAQMPERDEALLRAIFFEEQPKDEVCRRFGITRDYLRVVIHRAKGKFRSLLGPQALESTGPIFSEEK
jgi:RNA polymerase sigma-70 factor (ECF subfamily)